MTKETKEPFYTIQHVPITGIFIPLTPCYSRSCQINKQTCYSPLCPNKRISSLLRLVDTKQTEQDVDREQVFIYKYLFGYTIRVFFLFIFNFFILLTGKSFERLDYKYTKSYPKFN